MIAGGIYEGVILFAEIYLTLRGRAKGGAS